MFHFRVMPVFVLLSSVLWLRQDGRYIGLVPHMVALLLYLIVFHSLKEKINYLYLFDNEKTKQLNLIKQLNIPQNQILWTC